MLLTRSNVFAFINTIPGMAVVLNASRHGCLTPMKNVALLPFVIVALLPSMARASECRRYSDTGFHYSICAPADWKKNYREDGDRHHVIFRRARAAGTEIAVTALPAGGEGAQELSVWRKLLGPGTGQGFRKIIETKDLAAGDNVTVKVVVFDYYSRGVRMLQRTMFSRYGSNTLVIECRAPIGSFSRYTDVFNEVMSSVDYTGTEAGEAMNGPGEEKEVAPGKGGPKKPVALKKKPEQKKRPVAVKRKEPEPYSTVPKEKEGKKGLSISKPESLEDGSSAEKARGEKTETPRKTGEEAAPAGSIGNGKDQVIDVETVEDPEARKAIESELNTLQDMERRGLIEKVEEEQ